MDAAFQLFLRHGYRKVGVGDIAEAAQMSRPSLYASFPNKEAIFSAMVRRQRDRCLAESGVRLRPGQDLATRLRHLFDIWVLEPTASVIGSENGIELLANCGDYAPQAQAEVYAQLEAQLKATLQPEVRAQAALSAADLAYILRLATTSLKASADNEADLRRLIGGLIAMTLATVGAGESEGADKPMVVAAAKRKRGGG
ncbi:TetR/AcrR family transcriptional regulator [Xanthomonas sp. AM6]|uniref:TetR/AcrR family transcriptional regulator n=1 Tax=Xanthomonas sp. AM6 TaxID=2982531 RepID=UPI0021D8FF57|nr:TetR/AcrR family transcriptional regulator [Xanthomonas sp. AM6]UYB51283.1 TetR/AcrR family transcriptional regulator [Xanthomonas sp. AM6]